MRSLKKYSLLILFFPVLFLAGCEETNIWLATEAGVEAVKAVTLTDAQIEKIAGQASQETDSQHRIAPPGNKYASRLERLVGQHQKEDGISFNYKVYLDPTINAFAMADGTIRIYSGLMDMMDDGELRFVVGHEMGHVVKKHIKKKLMLAYAGRAVRKGVASQQSVAGDIARSSLGGLAETLLNAQFSQQEEREADDYGLRFLQQKEYEPDKAISALKKLATLGNDHSFLSSHPAPAVRAERLANRLANPNQPEPDLRQQGYRAVDYLLELWEKITRWLTLLTDKISQALQEPAPAGG
ncbi:MAG: M48 family metallopeptidase [Thermodesulfobacteriota bacterium]